MDNDFVPLINSYLKSEQYDDCPFNESLTLPNPPGHYNSGQINQNQYGVYGRSKAKSNLLRNDEKLFFCLKFFY